jgi:flagellar motor switch protein FliN/FliY
LAISSGTDANATPEIAVVAVVALAARAELATHLEALQALSSPAPTANPIGVPAEPAPGSIAAVPPLVAPDFGAVSSSTNGTHAPIAASPVLPAPTVRAAQFPVLTPVPPSIGRASLELLLGVSLEVSVEIGRTQMTIRDVLALTPGSIVELDKLAGEKVDVLVNRHHVATGEVVVVDENFGVRVTEIVARDHRLAPFEGRP